MAVPTTPNMSCIPGSFSSFGSKSLNFCRYMKVCFPWVGPGPLHGCQQRLPHRVDLDHPCILVPAVAPADLEADDVGVVQAHDRDCRCPRGRPSYPSIAQSSKNHLGNIIEYIFIINLFIDKNVANILYKYNHT